MGDRENRTYPKIVLIGIFGAVLILAFLILRPFLSAIFASFVLAYAFYPLYKVTKRLVKSKVFASLIVSVILVLIFTLPIVYLVNSLSTEARTNYVLVKKVLATGNIVSGECEADTLFCSIENGVGEFIQDPQVKFQLTNILNKITEFLTNATNEFIFSLPGFLLNFFIMVFIVYYLFKEGEVLVYRVRRLIPLKEVHQKNIVKQLQDVTYAVIYGQIVVAAGQGFLGGLGFWIFGFSAPVLWGIAMFLLALLPFLGTPIVWVPAVIIKIASGDTFGALGILLVGIFISTADNVIKPKLVSGRANIHPVLVLLGVIGGLILFGAAGIIVGPVILSVFVRFVEIYEEENIATTN